MAKTPYLTTVSMRGGEDWAIERATTAIRGALFKLAEQGLTFTVADSDPDTDPNIISFRVGDRELILHAVTDRATTENTTPSGRIVLRPPYETSNLRSFKEPHTGWNIDKVAGGVGKKLFELRERALTLKGV